MRYFLVSGKRGEGLFKASSPSKNKLKKSLPRYSKSAGEYCSMWDIEEISEVQYFNKRHLPDAPYTKEY